MAGTRSQGDMPVIAYIAWCSLEPLVLVGSTRILPCREKEVVKRSSEEGKIIFD